MPHDKRKDYSIKKTSDMVLAEESDLVIGKVLFRQSLSNYNKVYQDIFRGRLLGSRWKKQFETEQEYEEYYLDFYKALIKKKELFIKKPQNGQPETSGTETREDNLRLFK